jgi:hypothetical protein
MVERTRITLLAGERRTNEQIAKGLKTFCADIDET